MAAKFFGVEVNRSLDLSTDLVTVLISGFAILIALVPITYVAYAGGFLIVRPLLNNADYQSMIFEELKSPGFGPLRRYLLGRSNPGPD